MFHSIVETGGFINASQARNLPQSILSRHIKNIEAQLEVRLFNRNNSGTQITSQGEGYYQKTKDLLLELEAINQIKQPGKNRSSHPNEKPKKVRTLRSYGETQKQFTLVS